MGVWTNFKKLLKFDEYIFIILRIVENRLENEPNHVSSQGLIKFEV